MRNLLALLLLCPVLTGFGAEAPPAKAVPAPAAITADALRKEALAKLSPLPGNMPGAETDSPALVELGRKLYFDPRLSANQSRSCNSCHRLDQGRGGVDNDRTSVSAYGRRGVRNAPTTLNAGLHLAQGWDGRSADLGGQVRAHLTNPLELAMPGTDELIQRLGGSQDYPPLVARAFPQDPSLDLDKLTRALSAFGRTLLTRDRFDEFLKGDDQALTGVELKGLQQFLRLGCANCHNGPLLGGNSYQKLGAVRPVNNPADLGRFGVTQEREDQLKFKVPALRNVALTAPYFHDGSRLKLEDAVRDMASLQLGRQLQPADTQAITAFLGALTDKDREAARRGRQP